jgi:hypothetical protein
MGGKVTLTDAADVITPRPRPGHARALTQKLNRYREPSTTRSIVEIAITAAPLVVVWALMWAALELGRSGSTSCSSFPAPASWCGSS